LVIPSSDLLVGDIVRLEAGDCIPADGIVLEATSFAVNTSALTGESYPVAISPAYDEATTDQFKVFEMTIVEEGTAKVLVTAVSPDTFVSRLVQFIDPS
jgi:Mg2+-importing ATPase